MTLHVSSYLILKSNSRWFESSGRKCFV